MLLNLERSRELELLDGDIKNFSDYVRTMRELEIINRLTFGYRPTIAAVGSVVHRAMIPGRELSVLDVGFGYGDTLRELRRWADRNNVKLRLEGIDLNPWAKKAAEAATLPGSRISYQVGDVLEFKGGPYDFIVNALFMHHLRDDQIPRMLRWMTENSRLGWFINDLHRHPVAFHAIKGLTRAFSRSRFIINDAPLSVARAFTREDWSRYLALAGVPEERVRITWHWPFRYGVFYDVSL